jgi:hypothetical protein
MKSQPFPPARPGLSLREKYAAAQADLAKWSMLAAAPLRGPTDPAGSGLPPEASLFAKEGGARLRGGSGLIRKGAHEAERQPPAEGAGGEARSDLEDGRLAQATP